MSSFTDLTAQIALASIEMIDLGNEHAGIIYRRTGILRLDWAIADHSAKGGFGMARMYEISGPENAGKTTVTLALCASIQRYKKRNVVLYFDWEKKLNLKYAQNVGLSLAPDKFRLYRMTGVTALDEYKQLVAAACLSDDVGIIVTDSATGMISKAQLEGDVSAANIGVIAKAQSNVTTTFINTTPAGGPSFVWINQERTAIGSWHGGKETTGADAIRYFSSVRLSINRSESIKGKVQGNEENVGQKIGFYLKKNHIGTPGGKGILELSFVNGFDEDNYVFIAELCNMWKLTSYSPKTKMLKTPIGDFIGSDFPRCLTETQMYSLYDCAVKKRLAQLKADKDEWNKKKQELRKKYEEQKAVALNTLQLSQQAELAEGPELSESPIVSEPDF